MIRVRGTSGERWDRGHTGWMWPQGSFWLNATEMIHLFLASESPQQHDSSERQTKEEEIVGNI